MNTVIKLGREMRDAMETRLFEKGFPLILDAMVAKCAGASDLSQEMLLWCTPKRVQAMTVAAAVFPGAYEVLKRCHCRCTRNASVPPYLRYAQGPSLLINGVVKHIPLTRAFTKGGMLTVRVGEENKQVALAGGE